MNKYLRQIKEGIVDQNPTFMQFLGMCPTLATTTSVSNAIGMGLAATAVLICSNVIISLLRKFIPKEIRIASYIVIISGFVTAVELLMKAYLHPLYESLGLYIPLIVVNCIILARAEAFASKNPVLPSAVDGLAMGLGFTLSLCVIASVREILGAGTWFGLPIMGASYHPAIIFILPAGAFLTLGILSALVNKLKAYADAHPRPEKLAPEGVEVLPDEIITETASAEAAGSESGADTTESQTEKTVSEAANAAPAADAEPAAKAESAEENAGEAEGTVSAASVGQKPADESKDTAAKTEEASADSAETSSASEAAPASADFASAEPKESEEK